eukprot:TRINITY_DN3308_c0_g2_i1.p1 TRINITY_DN3308_c0_g2~~TRINITY_DN3308_c0_g2_i1.p1  ORF type:complete len:378 (+),score=49.93 TRINITY_DN3308_c0_g2_i1:737-1870(+)
MEDDLIDIEEAARKEAEKAYNFNLFKGEKILFTQKDTAISKLLFNLAVDFVLFCIIPELIVYFVTVGHYERFLFIIMFVCAYLTISFYYRRKFTFSSTLVLTNYRILSQISFDIVSLPYTNIEMKEWKNDGLQFWFTPNRDSNGGRAHIEASGLSEEEKRTVQELFFEGKSRDLSDFQPSVTTSPNYECKDKEIVHLVQDYLPFLWYYKLPRWSDCFPWTKVFILGLSVVFFLLAIGPGIIMLSGMHGLPIKVLSAIIVIVWFLIVLIVAFTTRVYFAITEKGLLRIETSLRGSRVQSLPFDKVYPIYSEMSSLFQQNKQRTPAHIRSHYLQTFGNFEVSGTEIIAREEIIFRKYLDTLNDGFYSTVEQDEESLNVL